MQNLAGQINSDVNQTALGINRVVNANMERAIRSISIERGYDPRLFTLVPFGGAGAMHACDLAQELGIPRILVPSNPGILSALGVAIADIVKDYSRTVMLRGADLDRARLDEEFNGMEGQAKVEMAAEGLASDKMVARRFLDVRYVGQSFELTVNYPSGRSKADLTKLIGDSFYKAHLRRFGYADKNEPVQVVNLRLKMDVAMEKPVIEPQTPGNPSPAPALIGEAEVVFQQGTLMSPIYQREQLTCGNRISGPALVIQMDATTVVTPGWCGMVDPFGNLLLQPE
jgi:N-methylhydantoinase A